MTISAEDHAEILNLYARYTHAIDSQDTDRWLSCWATDGEFDIGGGHFVGTEELTDFVHQFNATTKGSLRHYTTNIEIEEHNGQVIGRAYLLALIKPTKGFAMTGRYEDRLIKTDQGWVFAARTTFSDDVASVATPSGASASGSTEPAGPASSPRPVAASARHLAGKVVVVTGAGNGFGRLIAQRIGAANGKVVALDVDETALAETATNVQAAGGAALWRRTDVTDLDQMREAAAAAIAEFGRIDVLVNNAGVMPLAYLSEHEKAASSWDRAIDINIKGTVHGISAVYDQMIAQGAGHVVNISSIYGNAGVLGSAVYSATKAAINVLSDSLRIEAKGKIKVTTIRPTGVPGTNLGNSVINLEAPAGLTGPYADRFRDMLQRAYSGGLTEGETNPDSIQYWAITPDELVDHVIYAIDQPWGISISDVTVRASGDLYTY